MMHNMTNHEHWGWHESGSYAPPEGSHCLGLNFDTGSNDDLQSDLDQRGCWQYFEPEPRQALALKSGAAPTLPDLVLSDGQRCRSTPKLVTTHIPELWRRYLGGLHISQQVVCVNDIQRPRLTLDMGQRGPSNCLSRLLDVNLGQTERCEDSVHASGRMYKCRVNSLLLLMITNIVAAEMITTDAGVVRAEHTLSMLSGCARALVSSVSDWPLLKPSMSNYGVSGKDHVMRNKVYSDISGTHMAPNACQRFRKVALFLSGNYKMNVAR